MHNDTIAQRPADPIRRHRPNPTGNAASPMLDAALTVLFAAASALSCSHPGSNGDAKHQHRVSSSAPRVAVIVVPGLSSRQAEKLAGNSPSSPDETIPGDDPLGGLAWAHRGLWIHTLVPDETGITTVTIADALTGRTPAIHGIWGRRFRRFDQTVHPGPDTLLAEPIWAKALRQGLKIMTWDLRMAGSCDQAPTGHACVASTKLRRTLPPVPEFSPAPMAGPPKNGDWSGIPRTGPVPRPPGPSGYHLWATAIGPGRARIWLEAPAAILDRHELSVGEWAHGALKAQIHPHTGKTGVLPQGASPSAGAPRAHVWMRLLQADPKTGKTRLWVSRTRVLPLPPQWQPSGPGNAIPLPAPPPLAEPRLLARGRMDRTTYAQSVLLSGPQLVAMADNMARDPSWNLAIISWPAFADLARGLEYHPDRPDLTPADIPELRNLLSNGRHHLDAALGRAIESLVHAGVTVMVMSPGGLEPVQTKVRIGSLIRRLAHGTRIISQGSTALVYIPPEQRCAGAADAIAAALQKIEFHGQKPFGPGSRILTRPRFPASLKGGQAPDMLLQARAGFALSGRRSRKVFVWPTNAAADGQSPTTNSRNGFVFLVGPDVRKQRIEQLPATCVAALLADLLELPPRRREEGDPCRIQTESPTASRQSSMKPQSSKGT